jgi:TonB family protein
MIPSASDRLVMAAGLLGATLFAPAFQTVAQAASSQVASQLGSPGKRWAAFDFADPVAGGNVPVGQPLRLSITLGGVAQGHVPLVAVCQSVHFQTQTIPLEADPLAMVMKGTATLEPIPGSKLSVSPRVARVQVTFARSQKDKLERVMTRIVYVTLGTQEPASDSIESPLPGSDETRGDDAGQAEVQPDVTPVSAGVVVEEDLMPLPTPDLGQAYWQQISHLMSRSWSRHARRVRHSPSGETVRVRFRLYPSGRAQLIQIEKGSGAREIDEAGIHTVVHAQPFPSFPDEIGSEPVDVHVRMRTGARTMAKETRSVVHSPSPVPHAGPVAPKN